MRRDESMKVSDNIIRDENVRREQEKKGQRRMPGVWGRKQHGA